MVAYVLANGAADSQGDFFRRWLWQLTHNEVVGFSSGRPAIALALHVVLGLVWALIYARFVEGIRPALVDRRRLGLVARDALCIIAVARVLAVAAASRDGQHARLGSYRLGHWCRSAT